MKNHGPFASPTKTGNGRIGFSIHLAVFILVNALLIFINLAYSPGRLWVKWPLLGWGIGILFHGLAVFLFSGNSAVKQRTLAGEVKK
jgi:hypothetical protein